MRQYTLDGIELALKAIEHRKDCKTAAGIIRKLITTEMIKKGSKQNKIKQKLTCEEEFFKDKQWKPEFIDNMIFADVAGLAKAWENGQSICGDKISVKIYKQTWFNKLMKRIGL